MFHRTSIRQRLLAALVVPVVVIAAMSAFQVSSANRRLHEVQDETALARTAIGPGGIITALQDERNDGAAVLAGIRSAIQLRVKDTAEARTNTDDALAAFRRTLSQQGGEAATIYAPALKAVGNLDRVRSSMDSWTGPLALDNGIADQVYGDYTSMIDAFLAADDQLPLALDDAQLRTDAEALAATSRVFELTSLLARHIAISAITAPDSAEAKARAAELVGVYDQEIARARSLMSGPALAAFDAFLNRPSRLDFRAAIDTFIAGGQVDPTAVVALAADRSGTNGDVVRQRLETDLGARAAQLRDAAAATRDRYLAAAVAVSLLALALAILAARSITRPLHDLTEQAEDMAQRRLPEAVQTILDTPLGEDVVVPEMEPITVSSHDEVAEVAGALNTVQSSALQLAAEQALLRRNISDSFVNLGRRNQNLIGRQLDFISQLERGETDPEALDNLFRLDHLATRVRRNAESLVVLAGLEPPRQWSAPIAMGDVVRAALGEVEEYQRVVIQPVDEATVSGQAAADLVHVLAELVENGLSFSPPDRPVEILGRRTNGNYTLAVIDQGIGMTEEDLARANTRLSGAEAFTVAPSRYLGHYVAGHLAARLGVSVRLQESPAGGVTAKIVVPDSLLATAEEAAAVAEPEPEAEKVPLEASPAATAARWSVGVAAARQGAMATVGPEALPGHGTSGSTASGPVDGTPPAANDDDTPRRGLVRPPVRTSSVAPPDRPGGLPKRVADGEAPPAAPHHAATAQPLPRTLAEALPTAPDTVPDLTRLPPVPTDSVTANGLRKRVPGGNLPGGTGERHGFADGLDRSEAAREATADGTDDDGAADAVYQLLSSFDSGARRAREEARHDERTTDEHDPDRHDADQQDPER